MSDPHDPARGRELRRRRDTRDPRRSRERALKILFQADVRAETPADALARVEDDPRAWALLDDLDLDAASDLDVVVAQAAADADADTTLRPAEVAPAIDGFTRTLVLGVSDHRDALDALIGRYARRWTVSRMPVIDRNILRLGAYELQHESTSAAVVLNEVIELAKALSTEDSGRYVNGVLESIRKHVAAGAELPPPADGDDGDVSPAADDEIPPAGEGGDVTEVTDVADDAR